jgi:hypothetical protein
MVSRLESDVYELFIHKGDAFVPSTRDRRGEGCQYTEIIANASYNIASGRQHVEMKLPGKDPESIKYYCRDRCEDTACPFYLEN